MSSGYTYGQTGKRGSRRIFKLLEKQGGMCYRCKSPIDNATHFDFKDHLTCGTCALKLSSEPRET